jgi:O-acetyl-ADP-ribose deacetylase (regulator of RNase III)
MLFRVVIEKTVENLAVLAIKKSILELPNVLITNGNAASGTTEIKPISELNRTYREIRKDLQKVWWSKADGSKRKIMAECLVPGQVPPEYINTIYVANFPVAEKVRKLVQSDKIPIIPEPNTFFKHINERKIASNLNIVNGDLFFSRHQTITISVNCVGVMGKGIASRAKYQFPDVYVRYQDDCRSKKIRLGKPSLYKREVSYDTELADEPLTLKNANHETWFLLFATKDHWRNDSDINGIEEGLKWILKKYKKEGIESLALPALGCGLGNLKWENVGPLMCKYLSQLDIPACIHLPLEKEIPEEQLTKEFLLPNS